MTVDWQPTSKVLWQNIRDLISPPKLPPLKVTSQPVKVKDIWSKDEAFRTFSRPLRPIGAHVPLMVLLFSPLLYSVVTKATANPVNNTLITPIDISDYAMKLPPGKDKAGGGRWRRPRAEQLPATKGKLPKWSMTYSRSAHGQRRSWIPRSKQLLLGPPMLKIPEPKPWITTATRSQR